MNTAKAFVAIAMMGLVVASCSSDSASDSNPSLVNDQIQFATSTQPILHTRAVNNADNLQDKKFQQGEAINVYLTKHGTTDLLMPKGVTAAPTNCYKFTVGTAYTGTGSMENSQTLVAQATMSSNSQARMVLTCMPFIQPRTMPMWIRVPTLSPSRKTRLPM